MWVLVAGIAGTGYSACYNHIKIHCCFASSIDHLSSNHLTKFSTKFINFRQKNHFFDGSYRLKALGYLVSYSWCPNFFVG